MFQTNPDVSSLDLDFTVSYNINGSMVTAPLDPDSGPGTTPPRAVDNTNVFEYAELRIRRRAVLDIGPQLKALVEGFNDIVPRATLAEFNTSELELLMAGPDLVDVADWKLNTEYLGSFKPSNTLGKTHPRRVVGWFWAFVESLDNDQRQRLLRFVTGSSGVPVGGFARLLGNDGRICRFTLQPIEAVGEALPRAHTCFNRLDLPLFASREDLSRVMLQVLAVDMAITGFGME